MLAKELTKGVYAVSLGFVNVFLIDREELTLIDTGITGSDRKIIQAIKELGRQAEDLRHILITHLHTDHIGGLAALKQASGAKVYMHKLDAEAYLAGKIMRKIEPSPGWINSLMVKSITRPHPVVNSDLVDIECILNGNGPIPDTGGIESLYTPGHTCGHLAYFLPINGGIIFLGDAASHLLRLGYSFIYEDFSLGKETLNKIGQIHFEIACFSHGRPIIGKASDKIKERF